LISIIIPTINEDEVIENTLRPLQPLRNLGAEVILVDGGSSDQTQHIAAPLVDIWIDSPAKGRALQMNLGAAQANRDILWFLHADTVIPEHAERYIINTLKNRRWGRFDLKLSGDNFLLRIVEWMINHRSCWSGVATGDQGIFLTQKLFNKLDGLPEIALMEDIALSRKLKKVAAPGCIKHPLITSSRRWEKNGIVQTILLMWWLRFSYWLGVDPEKLVKLYHT